MPKKILIVDDEADLVETLTYRLKAAGFDVASACDGVDGLGKARREKPDLILLDVMMPKMDGYQVCRLLKFSNDTKYIPIIILTARSQDQDKLTGQDVGADLYITKPFEGAELVKKIQELLAKA